MYLLTKTKFKNFIISLLAFMLVITLAFATACGNTNDDDDKNDDDTTKTEETTITDYQVVTNGDFEFSTKDTTDYPYASSISWSRSTDSDNNTAPSSKYSSGIIDTKDEAFNKLESNEVPQLDGAKLNPGTPYSKGKISPEEAEGYYDYEDEDKRVNAQVKGSKILMIHNESSEEGLGTAQKFKSNANVSIPVNSYAILSIWVNTYDLKMKGDGVPGAYVLLTDKYGSNSYKNYEIRNINTNGEWQKFEICVRGSELVTTSFSITVGLGRGNGTFKKDYVEGFAFFDNIQATVYTAKEFKALGRNIDFELNVKDEAELIVESYAGANSVYALYYKYTRKDVEKFAINDGTYAFNTENVNASYDLTGEGKNVIGRKSIDALNDTTEKEIKDVTNDFSDLGIQDKNVIYFNFVQPSTGYYQTNEFTISQKGYHYITFYAKTYVELDTVKMAKVDIINTTKETPSWGKDDVKVISSYASFTTESVTDSAYGKWVKYGVLVKNPTDKATQYKIKFTFGDDETELIEDVYKLQKGYAIFAGLNVETISEDNYNLINNDSYLVKNEVLGVYAQYSEDSKNETTDNYNVTTDYYGKYEIESKPTSYMPDYKLKGTKDENVFVGVINSKYDYAFLNADEKAVLSSLKQESNEYAQVVLLKDNRETKDVKLYSNGYIIKKESFAKITYKLRVVGDSEVSVKLVNNDTTMPALELVAGETTKGLSAIVNKDTKTLNGWTEVCFYVAAGNEEINFRLEVSLLKGNGAVFLNKATNDTTTITSMDAFDSEINLLKEEFAKIDMAFADSVKHQRATAKVLSTDEEGNDVESSLSFEPIEVYTTNGLYTVVKFTTVHADEIIDNRTTEDDTTTPDTEEEEETEEYSVGTDVALQISSIILAVALIAVMVVVLVRNVRSKNKKKKVKVASFYDRNSRDEAMKKISKKKKDIIIEDAKDEEYDYEEAQKIDENAEEVKNNETASEETEETTETAEEVVEEVVEEVATDVEPTSEPSVEESTEDKE